MAGAVLDMSKEGRNLSSMEISYRDLPWRSPIDRLYRDILRGDFSWRPCIEILSRDLAQRC